MGSVWRPYRAYIEVKTAGPGRARGDHLKISGTAVLRPDARSRRQRGRPDRQPAREVLKQLPMEFAVEAQSFTKGLVLGSVGCDADNPILGTLWILFAPLTAFW
jgi:hypothetical protein